MATVPQPQKGGSSFSPLSWLGAFLRRPDGIPFALLIILLVLFSVLSLPGIISEPGEPGGFYFLFDFNGDFTLRTLVSTLNGAILTGILVSAVVILMISGEFDLSVGAILVIGAYVFGTLSAGEATILRINLAGNEIFGGFDIGEPLHPLLALVTAILACTFLGFINGIIVTYTKIPSFIATFGMLLILIWVALSYGSGAAFETTRNSLEARGISDTIYTVFNGSLRDINGNITGDIGNLRTSVFWMIGLGILMHLVLTRTRWGSSIFAIGGNPEAARSQGINIRRLKISSFMLTGAFAGVAGIVLFSQFLRVQSNSGLDQELWAIAAAVIGGTLLTGGFGSVLGGILGIMILSTIRSGIVLLSTPISNSPVGDIPALGEYIVRLTASDNFLTIVGFTIVGVAVLNTFIRRRL